MCSSWYNNWVNNVIYRNYIMYTKYFVSNAVVKWTFKLFESLLCLTTLRFCRQLKNPTQWSLLPWKRTSFGTSNYTITYDAQRKQNNFLLWPNISILLAHPMCEGFAVLQPSRFYPRPSRRDHFKVARGLDIWKFCLAFCLQNLWFISVKKLATLLCCGRFSPMEI